MTYCPLPNRRNASAGLTLVEVLVVLSIIAIAAGAAMLRLGIGQGADDLSASATTLALAITAASDQAMVSGHDQRLDIGPEGFRLAPVLSETDPLWQPLTNTDFADPTSASFLLAANGTASPFVLRLGSAGASTLLRFDGLQAWVEPLP